MTVHLQLIFLEAKIKTRFLFIWKSIEYRHKYKKLKKIDA